MKRFICFILALCMILPCSIPAMADDGKTAEKLILDAKEKFAISDDEFVFDSYSKDEYNGNVFYNLSWKSRKNDEYSDQPYISVRIEQDGDVESYRMSGNYRSDIKISKFSHDEILAKAKSLVEKIAPNRAEYIDGGKVSGDYQLTVDFERTCNGIPVSNDGLHLTLNPDDLSLIRYNANWTETEFPLPDGIISIDEAKNYYAENIGYELLYNIKTENSKIKDVYLSYETKDPSAYIDAFSGDAFKLSRYIYSTSGAMKEELAADSANRVLSPEEQQMVDEINKMITKEDAEKIARGVNEFSIRKDASVTGYRVYKNGYGDYIANIHFAISKKDEYYGANVAVNAKTREIVSFSESYNGKSKAESYDAGIAKKKAEDFLLKYYPEKMKSVKSEFIIGEGNKYRFAFDRYVNGVKVKGNGITVSVNEFTGEISNLNVNWAETDFPAADNVVSPKYIYNQVFAEDNFRLQYITSTEYLYDEITRVETSNTTAHLVYVPLVTPIYSAETAEEINYNGDPVTEPFKEYIDIEGHYCKDAAKALSQTGIYFEGGKLEPDKEISQAEFLKFVYFTFYGRYYPAEKDMYNQLIRSGVIEESEIGRPLTRIDGIRYFINALGFKEAAQIKGIYNCPFADVAEDMKGYASIAGGLKLINTDAPLLRADHVMTRAEALTIIYNYLKK